MAEKPIQVTAVSHLRRAAAKLRRAEMDAAGRNQAADALDHLASELAAATHRKATLLARAGLLALAVTLAMVVAGIWVDWRWAGTAVVVLVVALILLGVSHVAIKEVERGV